MNDTLVLLIVGLICAAAGAFLGWMMSSLKKKGELSGLQERLHQEGIQLGEMKTAFAKAQQETTAVRKEKDFLQNELTARNVEFENMESRMNEKSEEFNKLNEKFNKEFQNLANKILANNSKEFKEQNQESLNSILNPLKQRLEYFEKKVDKNNSDFLKTHAELGKQLEFLNEQNIKISQEADNLTKALKGDSKVQGNWGELILSRVLEESGLEEGREYTKQDSHDNPEEGGRLQSDVIVHLPNSKKMVIDSKVSLTDFEKYSSETDNKLKSEHLKNYDYRISYIRRHIFVSY